MSVLAAATVLLAFGAGRNRGGSDYWNSEGQYVGGPNPVAEKKAAEKAAGEKTKAPDGNRNTGAMGHPGGIETGSLPGKSVEKGPFPQHGPDEASFGAYKSH